MRVEVGDNVELAAAGAHFLQVRLELFEQRVVGRDRDNRHLGVDERKRPVLQFARRIRLGVDVRDFLQLERTFERDRIVQSAAEEQRVLLFRERLRPADQVRLERERALDGRGDVAQRIEALRLFFLRQAAAQLGERQRQQELCSELRGERL